MGVDMKIILYGTKNCKSCDMLFANLKDAISKLDKNNNIELNKVESIIEMSKKNIDKIPGLEIDGKIISKGFVYSVDDLIKIISEFNDKIDISKFNNQFVCDDKGCRLDDK